MLVKIVTCICSHVCSISYQVDVTAAILVAAGVDWDGAQNSHAPSYKAASWPNNTMFMAGLDIYTPLVLWPGHHHHHQQQQQLKSSDGSTLGRSEPSLIVATSRKAVVGSEYRGYAVATQHWKLVYMAQEGEGRLFDRDKDPLERVDLFEYEDENRTLSVLFHVSDCHYSHFACMFYYALKVGASRRGQVIAAGGAAALAVSTR